MSTRSFSDRLTLVEATEGGSPEGGSLRRSPLDPGPIDPGRVSCAGASTWARSEATRSGIRSAFGPVGGTTAPEGTVFFESTGGGGGAVALGAATARVAGAAGIAEGCAVTGGTGAAGAETLDGTTFEGGTAAALGFTSSVGFLQTLDPKAGTAAGGDEARGAYLSLDASARLANRRSSLPGSRRESLAAEGSMAMDERRE